MVAPARRRSPGKRHGGRAAAARGGHDYAATPIASTPEGDGSAPALAETKASTVPPDQLQLSEEELKREHSRILNSDDPNAPENEVRFSAVEGVFKAVPDIVHTACHLDVHGFLVHVSSEVAKQQMAREQREREEREREKRHAVENELPAGTASSDGKGGRNQFDFSERAAQTYNNNTREKGIFTDPPPQHDFAETASQWGIFDAFVADLERQEQEAERKKRTGTSGSAPNPNGSPAASSEEEQSASPASQSYITSKSMQNYSRLVERIVNQNSFAEILHDFRFWDDPADAFRDGSGSLLPLWRFPAGDHRAIFKKRAVTGISWNCVHSDLFAISYGSFDFLKQGQGIAAVFSLKNPSFPEYIYHTDSGAMCIAFHPEHPSLLAVGLYDGEVLVYDLQSTSKGPLFRSGYLTDKHLDPVWSVVWQKDDGGKGLCFHSVSTDGRVSAWAMAKNELQRSDVIRLHAADDENSAVPNIDTVLSGLEGGCCLDFNRHSEHLFLVGTEEGLIHRCSTAYSSQYLDTYARHHGAVYSLRWNPFSPRIFLSCSADWSIKVWDSMLEEPLLSFDAGDAVSDIAWAPYASTIFAAITEDGRVLFFNLAVNKQDPVTEQRIARRTKLTRLAFCPSAPLLVVGDEKNGLISLKLSPNLRGQAVKRADEDSSEQESRARRPPRRRGHPGEKSEEEKPKSSADREREKLESTLGISQVFSSAGSGAPAEAAAGRAATPAAVP